MPSGKPGSATVIINDFSGGLNTLVAPNRLPVNVSPSTTNWWNDDGALSKRPGQLQTSLTSSVYGVSWFGIALHTSVFSGVQELMIGAQAGKGRNFVLNTTDTITLGQLNTGDTGNADTTVGGAGVTGHSTSWLTTAAAGSIFSIGTTTGIISTVNSDTSLTLTAPFGVLNNGASFVITPSWVSTERISFADQNQKVWICGRGNSAVSWDGGTVLYVPAFPQCSYNLTANNYMFAARTTANPSRVFWSALTDPTTWPAANFVDVNPNDGFPITGLFYDGQSICILKYNTMWKLTGQVFDPSNPTYSLTQVYTPNDFSCNSPRSVQLITTPNFEGFIIYGLKGLYLYNGAGAVQKLTQYDALRSEWTAIGGTNFEIIADPSVECSSSLVDGSYWLAVGGSNVSYVIDPSGAPWKWSYANNGIVTDMAYLNSVLYGVNQNNAGTPGLIQLDTGSSDAQVTAISATYQTRLYEFTNQQRFGFAYLKYKKQSAGTVTFGYSIDGGAYVTTSVDMTAGAGGISRTEPILMGNIGYTVQFEVVHNVAAQPVEIYEISFDHQELRN